MRALAVLALLAAPAAAQSTDCAALSDFAAPFALDAGISLPPAVQDGGGCLWSGVTWTADGDYGQRVSVETLRLNGVGLDRLALRQMPGRIELRVTGLQVGAKVPDAVFDWALQVQGQRKRIDIDLLLTHDPEAQRLVLERLDADFPGDNRISLSWQMTGLDLTTFETFRSTLGGLAPRQMDLVVQSNGLFEDWALMPLAPFLLTDGDVPAQVQAARVRALEVVDTLLVMAPDLLTPGSREALSALLDDLPTPSGTLTLSMTSQPAALPEVLLGWVIFGDWPDASSDWAGTVIDATWTKEPAE